MDSSKKQAEKTNKGDLYLKKHVGLIHCENRLSLIQRKISNILLFNAISTIHNSDIFEIPLRDLCALIGFDSKNEKAVKIAIKSLMSIVMEWNLLEDEIFYGESDYCQESITWNASSLLAGASINNGRVSYSYSPQMKSILSSLDIYGKINLLVQAKFNSSYSLVLYENCIRFKNLKQTAWFSLKLFRTLMGVEEGKYESFKEFKRNVINVAVKEINAKSDIFIEPNFKKAGRNIVSVQFKLSGNPTFNQLHTHKKIGETYVNSEKLASLKAILLTEFKLNEKLADNFIKNFSYEYIISKIDIVKRKKGVRNYTSYLISAISLDFQEKSVNLISLLKGNEKKENPSEEFRSFQYKVLYELFDKMPLNEKNSILRKFVPLLRGADSYRYERFGLDGVIQELLCLYLIEQKHKLLSNIPSYEDWKLQEGKLEPA